MLPNLLGQSVFRYATELKLRDTDAAGVAFFAAYYAIAHDVYESFLHQHGASLTTWLSQVHLPIVHSEADYTAPLRLGDSFEVILRCDRIGERSFTLTYEFTSAVGSLAQLKTIHVAVPSRMTSEEVVSALLPERLRELLHQLQPDSSSDGNHK